MIGRSLFNVGSPLRNKFEFTVVLEGIISNRNNGNASLGGYDNPSAHDKKRLRQPYQSKTFRMEISFTASVSMQAV